MTGHILVETNVNLSYKPLQLSWLPMSLKCQRGSRCPHMQWVAFPKRNIVLGESTSFPLSGIKPVVWREMLPHLSSLSTTNTILWKEPDIERSGPCSVGTTGRLCSQGSCASPNRYLGYMEYFYFNVIHLSISRFDLCFMVVVQFFVLFLFNFLKNSFTSMLEWLSLIFSSTHLVFMVFFIHVEFIFCIV